MEKYQKTLYVSYVLLVLLIGGLCLFFLSCANAPQPRHFTADFSWYMFPAKSGSLTPGHFSVKTDVNAPANDGGSLDALLELIRQTEDELICSFGGSRYAPFDAGIEDHLLSPGKTMPEPGTAQRKVFEIGQAMEELAKRQIRVSLIFDAGSRCQGDLLFLEAGYRFHHEEDPFKASLANDNLKEIERQTAFKKLIAACGISRQNPVSFPAPVASQNGGNSSEGYPELYFAGLPSEGENARLRNNLCFSRSGSAKKVWVSSAGLNGRQMEQPGFSMILGGDASSPIDREQANGPGMNSKNNYGLLIHAIERELLFYRQGISGDKKQRAVIDALASGENLNISLRFSQPGTPRELVTSLASQLQQNRIHSFYAGRLSSFSNRTAPNEKPARELIAKRLQEGLRQGEIQEGFLAEGGTLQNFSNGISFYESMHPSLPFVPLYRLPGAGAGNFFLLAGKNKQSENKPYRLLFYNGDLGDEPADGDTLLLIMEFQGEANPLPDFFQGVRSQALAHEAMIQKAKAQKSSLQEAQWQDIVVNEIFWAGECSGVKKENRAFGLELYNQKPYPLDLGNWVVACSPSSVLLTPDSLFAAAPEPALTPSLTNIVIQLPQGSIIAANGFYTVASNEALTVLNASTQAAGVKSDWGNIRQCILLANEDPANGNRRLIDRVLSGSAESWQAHAKAGYSRTGLANCKNGLSETSGKNPRDLLRSQNRSMEKISPELDGSKVTAWQTMNRTFFQNRDIRTDYRLFTFHTLGRQNSGPGPNYDIKVRPKIVISEIAWMGAFRNDGTGFAQNEYVEFINFGENAVDMGGWIFGCSSSGRGATGKPLFAFPREFPVYPGEIITVYRQSAEADFPGGEPIFLYSFVLANDLRQCILTDGSSGYFSAIGVPSPGEPFGGHYGDPLFYGNAIDIAGDRSASFSSLGLGVNDYAARIRRSAERADPAMPGYLLGSWKTNPSDIGTNTQMNEPYRLRTFGSPGYSAFSSAAASVAGGWQ